MTRLHAENVHTLDQDRASEIFARGSEYIEGVGSEGPGRNEAAIALLKSDPDEYFRLAKIWSSRSRG